MSEDSFPCLYHWKSLIDAANLNAVVELGDTRIDGLTSKFARHSRQADHNVLANDVQNQDLIVEPELWMLVEIAFELIMVMYGHSQPYPIVLTATDTTSD